MGTPAFAVPVLAALLQEEHWDVVAVITSVDQYGGRGRKQLIESPVKKYALEKGLMVLQPPNLKAKAFVREFQELQPDLSVVVAFRMLPECIWSIPKSGTINLHASLLPAYRGAAPINWAIIRGEKTTGVTTFLIAKEIDTGALIDQAVVSIDPGDNAGSLHDKMLSIGPKLVVKSVKDLFAGGIVFHEQDEGDVSLAPKLYKENTEIDFSQGTQSVHNFVRGLSPHPGAWMLLDDQVLKVYKTSYHLGSHARKPGEIVSDGRKWLQIFCKNGYVELLELQLQGKKRMDIKAFLNGYKSAESSQINLENG